MSASKLKSLAKDSVIYGISGIVSKMIAVLLVPLYTRIFTPSDYGVINIINTTFMLVGMLAACSLDNSAGRWYYDTQDELDRKKTFASWFWFQFAVSGGLALILILITPLVFTYILHLSFEGYDILIWIFPSLTLISNILPIMIWNWFRFNRKPVATIIFTLSQSLFTIGLTILFVVYLRLGIKGVYAALFISSLFFTVIAFAILKSWIHIKHFSMVRMKEMLKFSIPLIPAALAFWLLNATGSYFLLYYSTKEEVGLFSIGASIASAVSLVTGSFQQAWGPFAFSIIHDKDAKKTYADVFLIFSLISGGLILGMFLFAPEILWVFTTPDYYSAAWVASILSINIVLITFSYIASIGAAVMKNNNPYSIGVIIGSVLTVLFNVVMIPMAGKEGAAISMVLGQVSALIYLFYKVQKIYPVNYRFREAIFLIVLSVVLGIIGRVYTGDIATIGFIILIKSFILLLFTGAAYIALRKEVNGIVSKLLNKG